MARQTIFGPQQNAWPFSECPNCGAYVQSSDENCKSCGFSMPKLKVCPKCSRDLPFTATQCGNCRIVLPTSPLSLQEIVGTTIRWVLVPTILGGILILACYIGLRPNPIQTDHTSKILAL